MTESKVTYEIRKGDTAPCTLVSVVETGFGGRAENFVADGTYTFCLHIKSKLEARENEQ